MRAGKLRHHVTVQELKRVQDPVTLQITESWQKYCRWWCDIAPSSGREFIAAQAVASKVTGKIVGRYLAGITHDMRIFYRGKTYNIEAVLPDNKSGLEWLTLLVSEGVHADD